MQTEEDWKIVLLVSGIIVLFMCALAGIAIVTCCCWGAELCIDCTAGGIFGLCILCLGFLGLRTRRGNRMGGFQQPGMNMGSTQATPTLLQPPPPPYAPLRPFQQASAPFQPAPFQPAPFQPAPAPFQPAPAPFQPAPAQFQPAPAPSQPATSQPAPEPVPFQPPKMGNY